MAKQEPSQIVRAVAPTPLQIGIARVAQRQTREDIESLLPGGLSFVQLPAFLQMRPRLR